MPKAIIYSVLAAYFSGLVLTQLYHGDWLISLTLLPFAVLYGYRWINATN